VGIGSIDRLVCVTVPHARRPLHPQLTHGGLKSGAMPVGPHPAARPGRISGVLVDVRTDVCGSLGVGDVDPGPPGTSRNRALVTTRDVLLDLRASSGTWTHRV